jgi:hypothetical protein
MADVTGRPAGGLLLVALAVPVLGCARPAAAPGVATVATTRAVSAEPGRIELSDPKVTFEQPNLVRFEVRYRFTQGKPDKYYLCEVSFPGTTNRAAKTMESWELKPEGVIKDGIVLATPPVTTFEIRVSEADSPQDGYKPISNVLSGPVKPGP